MVTTMTIAQLLDDPAQRAFLTRLAREYIWWKSPSEALAYPHRVVAQAMDLGTWDDVLALEEHLGPSLLREVLVRAEAGWFHPRSWHFWHYRLGVVPPGEAVPPLPKRRIP
jgi:hypothetical protein